MTANNYRISLNQKDKYINIPIQIKTDELGRDDLIDKYEEEVIEKVINPIDDFEITRFGHKEWIENNLANTKITYDFNFFNHNLPVDSTNSSNENLWVTDYVFTDNPNYTAQTFSDREIYYGTNSFKRSFFKLDFYDSVNSETQQHYMTIILPTQQGVTRSSGVGQLGIPDNVDIKTPNFVLDYIGDKEGFFVYWLKNTTYLNIDTFYVSAKFFNAKTGEFVRMMNAPQSSLSRKFNFKKELFFYYKVVLDYDNYEYEVRDTETNLRIGTTSSIKWYEYVNPE